MERNFRLSQPSLAFMAAFCFRCRGNKQLVDHFTMNVPGVVAVCKRSRSEYALRVNANRSEYSIIGESGNIYESRKISSSVNLQWAAKVAETLLENDAFRY